jgi:putative Mn2+ efflux pump MntP
MSVPKFRERQVFQLALYFGIFHICTTAVGMLAGQFISDQLYEIGQFLSFALLAVIGGHMIWESKQAEKDTQTPGKMSQFRMLTLAIATSIDALAAGVSLGITAGSILFASAVVGAAAFLMTLAGAFLGEHVGGRFHKQAGLIGGLVLIALGIRSLF